MSTSQQLTAERLLLKVRIATHQIEAARKQAVAMYDEDLRALKELDAKLATVQTVNEPELFSPDKLLSPDLSALIDSPLARYN